MTKAKESIAIRSNLKLIGWILDRYLFNMKEQYILKFNELVTEGIEWWIVTKIKYLKQKAGVYPFNQCIVLEGHE